MSTAVAPRVSPPAPGAERDLVIHAVDLARNYEIGAEVVHALRGVNLDVRRNEFVAIMGPSGSGKSTLMEGTTV